MNIQTSTTSRGIRQRFHALAQQTLATPFIFSHITSQIRRKRRLLFYKLPVFFWILSEIVKKHRFTLIKSNIYFVRTLARFLLLIISGIPNP